MERKIASESREKPKPSATQNDAFAWLEGVLGNPVKPAADRPKTESRPTSISSFFGNPVVKTAKAVPGQPGYVYSPYARTKMVNVSNFEAGQEVRCPHTGRSFAVPVFDSVSKPITASPISRIASNSPSGNTRRERSRQRFRVEPDPGIQIVAPDSVEVVRIESEAPDPEPNPAPPTSVNKPDGLVATGVPGRPNQVYSPYANKNQIVDVTGIKPGDKARCPYTDRVFIVPGGTAPTASVSPPLKQKPGTRKPTPKPEPKKKVAPKSVEQQMIAPPKEKPAPAPEPNLDPDPKPAAAPAPKTEPKPTPKPETKPAASGSSSVPSAGWSDKKGYAKSPFGGHLVDVTGKSGGSVVRCPFSGKQFKVPAGSN